VSPAVKHLSFRNLDFACDAPLLMLDVNAPLEGDVEKFFTPYDHDINLKVFRTLCDRYGVDISENDVIGLMRHLESFECAGLLR
jgi:hypothetical protein